MVTLFSYRITHDTGAAPNPFWGVCTLVICKPRIRLAAQVGDWIVGTASANSPSGNISDRMVYAIRVNRTMTMQEYDTYIQQFLPQKVARRVWKKAVGLVAVGRISQERCPFHVPIPRSDLSWSQSGVPSLTQHISTGFFHTLSQVV